MVVPERVVQTNATMPVKPPNRIFGFWCEDPKSSGIYLLYSILTYIFLTTLVMMHVFLMYTWLTVNSSVSKFPAFLRPNDPDAGLMREYYTNAFYWILTTMAVYILMSFSILTLAINGTQNSPSNPGDVITTMIRAALIIMFATTSVIIWEDANGNEIPLGFNYLLGGLLYYISMALIVRRAVRLIMKTSKPGMFRAQPQTVNGTRLPRIVANQTDQNRQETI